MFESWPWTIAMLLIIGVLYSILAIADYNEELVRLNKEMEEKWLRKEDKKS